MNDARRGLLDQPVEYEWAYLAALIASFDLYKTRLNILPSRKSFPSDRVCRCGSAEQRRFVRLIMEGTVRKTIPQNCSLTHRLVIDVHADAQQCRMQF
jgi:hypothetical protein